MLWPIYACIALLCAQSALAQVQETTNGTQPDLTGGRCACPTGFKGDGTFCCVPKDMDLCTTKGDQDLVLTAISGQEFRLEFPCTKSLGTVFQDLGDDRTCEVTVGQSGNLVESGAIYDNQFVLRVEARNDTETVAINIKINGSFLYNSLSKQEVDILTVNGSTEMQMLGHKLKFGYDEQARVWTINICGADIYLRGYEGNDGIQIETPGVCISAPNNTFNDSFCTKDESYDSGGFRTPSERLLSDMILDYERLSTYQFDIEDASLKPVCTAISDSFKQCNDRPAAMAACGNRLLVTLERRCLTVDLSNPLTLFKDCIAAFCTQDSTACDRLKSDVAIQLCDSSTAQQCDSWLNLDLNVAGLNVGLNAGIEGLNVNLGLTDENQETQDTGQTQETQETGQTQEIQETQQSGFLFG